MSEKVNLINLEIADEVSKLVSEGKIKESLEWLKKLKYSRVHRKEVLGIISRYKILERDEMKGTITFQETVSERNKIIDSIVKLIPEPEDFDKNVVNQSKIKMGLLAACIISAVLIIIVLLEVKKQKIEEIKKIDFEIAKRIEMIDISDWYRYALVTGSSNSSTLCSCLIDNVNGQCFYDEKYREQNLKSLLILLLEKVPPHDKKNVQDALNLLSEIKSKYTDALLNQDPTYVIQFYKEVINLNALRWVGINNLDRDSLIEETSQIEIVFKEQFD